MQNKMFSRLKKTTCSTTNSLHKLTSISNQARVINFMHTWLNAHRLERENAIRRGKIRNAIRWRIDEHFLSSRYIFNDRHFCLSAKRGWRLFFKNNKVWSRFSCYQSYSWPSFLEFLWRMFGLGEFWSFKCLQGHIWNWRTDYLRNLTWADLRKREWKAKMIILRARVKFNGQFETNAEPRNQGTI